MHSTTSYKATACGPGCGDTLDHGTLWITDDGASFQGATGAFTLPMEGLRMDRAGATGDTIRITNPAHPDWFISTTELSIIRDPQLISRAQLHSSLKRGRRRSACCISGCVSVILLAVVIVFGIVASKDFIVGSLANHFPKEWEKKLGDALLVVTLPETSRVTDAELVAGLNTIAGPVLEAIPESEGFTSFTIHLSADPTPNAFAIPGGHIIVNSGLITLADTPEEVAGVIAHEAGHATLRHGLQSLINRIGTVALISVIFGDAEGVTAVLVEGSDYLLAQKYSRDAERQADDKAWQYLEAANVNPAGLVTFFEKLKTVDGSGAATMPTIMSTHPATDERIQALEKKLQAAPKDKSYRPINMDYAAYKAAVLKAQGH